MKYIELSQGKSALVDDADFEYLSQWKWTFDSTIGYAYRRKHLPSTRKNQKCKKIYMHRLLNETPDGLLTDHINRNRLDNRRSNLRTVTKSQSQVNRGVQSNSKSGVKGVSWSERDKVWTVELHRDRTRLFRKSFKSFDDAVKARQEAEKEYHLIKSIN